MPRAGTPPPSTEVGAATATTERPSQTRPEDPIAEAAARARERLRRQREIAVAGLQEIATEAKGELPVPEAEPELEPEPVAEPPKPPSRAPAPKGDIAELRHEVDALRRDLQEAVAQLSRDMERAERVAADRARKEARKQGRKSERAARRAVQAAMDTPDDPT